MDEVQILSTCIYSIFPLNCFVLSLLWFCVLVVFDLCLICFWLCFESLQPRRWEWTRKFKDFHFHQKEWSLLLNNLTWNVVLKLYCWFVDLLIFFTFNKCAEFLPFTKEVMYHCSIRLFKYLIYLHVFVVHSSYC